MCFEVSRGFGPSKKNQGACALHAGIAANTIVYAWILVTYDCGPVLQKKCFWFFFCKNTANLNKIAVLTLTLVNL